MATAKKKSGTTGKTTKQRKASTAGSRSSTRKTSGKASSGRGSSGRKTSAGRPSVRSGAAARRQKPELSPEELAARKDLKEDILLIVLIAVAVFLMISVLGFAGRVGRLVSMVMFGVFGFIAYIIPVFSFFAIIFCISNRHSRTLPRRMIAAVVLLFVFGIACELTYVVSFDDLTNDAITLFTRSAQYKGGGGVLCGIPAWAMMTYFRFAGTILILLAAAVICVILITGRSFTRAYRKRKAEHPRDPEAHPVRDFIAGRRDARQKARRRKEIRRQEAEERRLRRRRENREDDLLDEDPSLDTEYEATYGPIHERESEYESTRRPARRSESEYETTRRPVRTSESEYESTRRPARKSESEYETTRRSVHGWGHRSEYDPEPDYESGEDIVSDEPEAEMRTVRETGRSRYPKKNPAQEYVPGEHEPASRRGGFRDAEEDFYEKRREEDEAERRPERRSKRERSDLHFENDFIHADDWTDTVPENERRTGRRRRLEPDEDFDTVNDEDRSEVSYRHRRDGRRGNEENQAEHPVRTKKSRYAGERRSHEDPEEVPFIEDSYQDEDENFTEQGSADINVHRERNNAAGTSVAKSGKLRKSVKVSGQRYVFPSLNLLERGKRPSNADTDRELRQTARKLQDTLQTFGVNVTMTDISQGPSVTRYEMQPERGVKVSKILSLSDDIKLSLAALDIRIEAPIPGKSAIGIEVPNKENTIVALRDLLESKEFRNFKGKLPFAVGRDIAGKVVVTDIAKMPHLLIAGATGSGKSVCINTIIMSILYRLSPDEVRLLLIDPKVVELSVYNGIPHLLLPVVTDTRKASAALNWAVAEMTRRYKQFAEAGVRDLEGYNSAARKAILRGDDTDMEPMPRIVVIVDELADLMMVAKNEVETAICRLAQLARAAGIHLIIATQRPSVDVITGLIKANMPSRIAFAVTSQVDSRTILDMAGGEKLIGKGDMLFYPLNYQKPARIQGAFVSDNEVSDVVDDILKHNRPVSETQTQEMEKTIEMAAENPSGAGAADGRDERDEHFADAGRLVTEKKKASIGMLQRMYRIGFNRASRVMSQLSEAGVVSEEDGTKARKVLMTPEEFEEYLEQEHLG